MKRPLILILLTLLAVPAASTLLIDDSWGAAKARCWAGDEPVCDALTWYDYSEEAVPLSDPWWRGKPITPENVAGYLNTRGVGGGLVQETSSTFMERAFAARDQCAQVWWTVDWHRNGSGPRGYHGPGTLDLNDPEVFARYVEFAKILAAIMEHHLPGGGCLQPPVLEFGNEPYWVQSGQPKATRETYARAIEAVGPVSGVRMVASGEWLPADFRLPRWVWGAGVHRFIFHRSQDPNQFAAEFNALPKTRDGVPVGCDEGSGGGRAAVVDSDLGAQLTVAYLDAAVAAGQPFVGLLSLSDNVAQSEPCELPARLLPDMLGPEPKAIGDWGVCLELTEDWGSGQSRWTKSMWAVARWAQARGKEGRFPGGGGGGGPEPDIGQALIELERVEMNAVLVQSALATIRDLGGFEIMLKNTNSRKKKRKLKAAIRRAENGAPRAVYRIEKMREDLDP